MLSSAPGPQSPEMREKSMAPKGIAAALATAAIGMTDVALAQSYPERTVEITVPSSPGAAFHSAHDLIAAAKAKPGGLNYGHPGTATIPHLAMIEFARMANVEFNQVPFKGPAEAVQMAHAGQIDFAAVPLSTAATSGL